MGEVCRCTGVESIDNSGTRKSGMCHHPFFRLISVNTAARYFWWRPVWFVCLFQLTHSYECDPTKIGLPFFALILSIIAHTYRQWCYLHMDWLTYVLCLFQLTHSYECDPTKIGLPFFALILSIIAHTYRQWCYLHMDWLTYVLLNGIFCLISRQRGALGCGYWEI